VAAGVTAWLAAGMPDGTDRGRPGADWNLSILHISGSTDAVAPPAA